MQRHLCTEALYISAGTDSSVSTPQHSIAIRHSPFHSQQCKSLRYRNLDDSPQIIRAPSSFQRVHNHPNLNPKKPPAASSLPEETRHSLYPNSETLLYFRIFTLPHSCQTKKWAQLLAFDTCQNRPQAVGPQNQGLPSLLTLRPYSPPP